MKNSISNNLQNFQKNLPNGVTLIAVSKTKPIEDIRAAYDAGHRDFGENRIQEMAEKAEELPKDIRWHAIGHIQGNKIKYMAEFVHLVHGIDKEKRLKELNKEAKKSDRKIACLLQIHIAKEESKFGFDYEEAEEVLTQNLEEKYPFLEIKGLMGMATFTDNKEQIHSEFRGLSDFFKKIKAEQKLSGFEILSMGMSGDYQIAITKDTTMVRIGSAIFGARD